jgi:serine/threonine protein kinase
VVDLSGFEEGSRFDQRNQVLTQVHVRRLDAVFTVVKFISFPLSIDGCHFETEIENQMNLRHPRIARLIRCGYPVESDWCWELKTMRLYVSVCSLADVLLNPPIWWTPTMKAKAVIGIALGLRFSHGHELLHGSVKASNIFFNVNHTIQLVDSSPIRLELGSIEPFSGEE